MGAVLSADGVYRYMLTRELAPLGPQRSLTWVMLNPSTADAEQDDPTIRRVRAFSLAWGATRFCVVNLYAFRATKPADLPDDFATRQGPEWLYWTGRALLESDGVVYAWGAHPQAPYAARSLERLACPSQPLVLGLTKHGAPRHPLYVAAGTPLQPYHRAALADEPEER